MFNTMEESAEAESLYDVVIVGGGLAGLACARKLQDEIRGGSSWRIALVEAKERVGGRVLASNSVPGFEGELVSLGAEFVHGDGTVLHEYAREGNWELKEVFITAFGDGGPGNTEAPDGGAGYYYDGVEKKLMRFDQLPEELKHLRDVLDELGVEDSATTAENNSLKTQSVFDFLLERNVSRRGLAFAEAGYGNTLGASLHYLSLGLTKNIERLWNNDGGDCDFRIKESTEKIVRKLDEESNKVHKFLNRPVEKIVWNGSEQIIMIEFKDGKASMSASHVVVTVPVPILQRHRIACERLSFEPSLSEEKLDALRRISSQGAMKIMVKFSSRFWPQDMHGTICSDSSVPEFWDAGLELSHALMGFVFADAAASLGYLTDEQVIHIFLEQLDEIFEGSASFSFTCGFVFRWENEPYIRGGYSFPSIFEEENTRKSLAKSEFNGRLHFAGEATDFENAYMTMHSAIRTGERAATEIIQDFKAS